jgi:hypothetical protein
MFGYKRKVTLEAFSQELARLSLVTLSKSWEEKATLWNAAIDYGANPDTILHELVFLSCVSTWHALFTAKARKKITFSQWQFLNERFLVSVMEELSKRPLEESPWGVPLPEVLHARLEEYRGVTAGAHDPIEGILAMCRVFSKVCSDDPSNPKLVNEAKVILGIGTNKLVDIISSVKFVS